MNERADLLMTPQPAERLLGFQESGFAADRIDECHGSIHHLQCLDACMPEIWPADDFIPEVDMEKCRLLSDLPRCPACDGIARPNILMFGDWSWVHQRETQQAKTLAAWVETVTHPVIIELGAGTDIPSVRSFCERMRRPLIRINPREPKLGGVKGIGLAMGALDAVRAIHAALDNTSFFAET